MAKRKYSVWLYRKHDMDLLSLEEWGISITMTLYGCLKAFCNGEVFVIQMPKEKSQEEKSASRRMQKKIALDEESDADIIAMLDRLNKGARNNFFKQLLRLYLCRPLDDRFYHTPEDAKWFEGQLKIFQENRACIDAERYKKRAWTKRTTKAIPKEAPMEERSLEAPPADTPPAEAFAGIPIREAPISNQEEVSSELPFAQEEAPETIIENDPSPVSDQEEEELTELFASIFE